jgi:putative peptidoglycan lipid II flippase
LDFKDIYLRRMILLVVPIILGSSTHQINQIIDRTIASQIAIGGITTLSYAQKLDSFFKDIFILSVVTVLYPNISRMAAGNLMDHFKKAVADAVSSISLLVIPATIGILIFSKPIVVLLFNRGAFNAQAVTMTANALFFYSLGITAVGIRSTFIKSMYSLKDTRTPVINSMIAMAVNIMLNILFSRYLGIGGIALANSISAILAMILMFISLRKKIGPFGMRKVAVTSLKILSVSLGMGLTAKLSFEMLKSVLSQNLSLILSVVIGIILYLVAISYAKIEMVNTMRDMILVKMKNLFGRTVSEEIPSFQSDLSRKI